MKNLKQIKMYVPMFYSGGRWVENPVVYNNGEEVDKRFIGFMSDIMHFLMESDFTKQATKIFLKSHITGEKAALADYNASVKEDKRLDYVKAHNNIYYDASKLDKAFEGRSVVDELLNNPESYDFFKKRLYEMTVQLTSQSPQAKEVSFPILCTDVKTELSKEDFQTLLLVLNRYSKKRLESLGRGENKELHIDCIKYFNYLTMSSMLNDTEKKRLEKLNEALGLDPHTTFVLSDTSSDKKSDSTGVKADTPVEIDDSVDLEDAED